MSTEKKKETVIKVPHVRRVDRGWELVELHITGDKIVKTVVKHGPDLRRICLSLALAEMTRN